MWITAFFTAAFQIFAKEILAVGGAVLLLVISLPFWFDGTLETFWGIVNEFGRLAALFILLLIALFQLFMQSQQRRE